MISVILISLGHVFGWLVRVFSSRENLILENLALRQQLLALHAKRPRHRLTALHKLFWVVLRRLWAGWKEPLILVTPRTVVGWHQAGFRLYWKWLSGTRQRRGRKSVSKEIRALIFRMVAENPTWGAPRIHGELLKLGFDLSETTVSRWVRRAPRTSALWIVQQMREAWPYASTHRFLVFDRDSKFGVDVVSATRGMGSKPIRTAFRSPWQNGVAERWVGTCRRDLLDHVIVLNERHLKRLLAEYVRYYHEDRTHLGLAKDTPVYRPVATRLAVGSKIQSFPRLGGLHHRYVVAA